MTTGNNNNLDPRISKIVDMLQKLGKRPVDDVEAIITEVRSLDVFLKESQKNALDYEERVNSILEVLLKYTLIDFSEKATVSELGDDIDAIAVGINTLAEELEDKIRTEKNIQEQLLDQNSKLEKINKELASFAYVSSHDLQEPLRKINTFVSRILEEELDALPEQVKFYFERIQSSATRMQKLIKDILEYSKLNAADIELEKTDLTKLVKEVKEDFHDTLIEKKVTFTIDELCEVNAVPFRIRRLFSNLVGNSIKFSHAGREPHITVSSKKAAGKDLKNKDLLPGKKYCHIVFADNGIGFESHFNEKIFEVFQRLHNQAEYQGTGIGLAICRRIVENHHGLITATGELGKGARFDIFLPA